MHLHLQQIKRYLLKNALRYTINHYRLTHVLLAVSQPRAATVRKPNDAGENVCLEAQSTQRRQKRNFKPGLCFAKEVYGASLATAANAPEKTNQGAKKLERLVTEGGAADFAACKAVCFPTEKQQNKHFNT